RRLIRCASRKRRPVYSTVVQRIHKRRRRHVRWPERHHSHVGVSWPHRLWTNVSRMDLQHASWRRRTGPFRIARSRRHSLWKYAEYKQIASEFSKLQHLGFPRYHKPEVAIAYSFESNVGSHPPGPSNTVRQYFTV